MKRRPTLTQRQRGALALVGRQRAAEALPPGAKRESLLNEVTRARVAAMFRRRGRG